MSLEYDDARSRRGGVFHFLSPFTADGNPIGIAIRTTEVIVADILGLWITKSIGLDCGPWAAAGTLFYILRQSAELPRHQRDRRSGLQRRWNIHRDDEDVE